MALTWIGINLDKNQIEFLEKLAKNKIKIKKYLDERIKSLIIEDEFKEFKNFISNQKTTRKNFTIDSNLYEAVIPIIKENNSSMNDIIRFILHTEMEKLKLCSNLK